MEQLNKVVSVFILLAIAIFVLWLLLSRSQTIKSIISGKTTIVQELSGGAKTKETPTPTISLAEEGGEQQNLTKQMQDNLDSAERTDTRDASMPGKNSLQGDEPTTAPNTNSYPNTGTPSQVTPLLLLVFVIGKVMLHKS